MPIATLMVTGVILYNQNRIEERRLESEITKQFAATVKELDAQSKSTRLGAVLALENFIDRDQHYRSQVYLLLGSKLRDETSKDSTRDAVLVNQITETFRKISKVRLAKEDAPISLFLKQCNFDSLNLSWFDLRAANLAGADLTGADLRNANLADANLTGANLLRAWFYSADLTYADLSGADLRGANLRSANLGGADLGNANLRGAHLKSAILVMATLAGADLTGADLREANLSAANISIIDLPALIKAFYWQEAILDSCVREEAQKLAEK